MPRFYDKVGYETAGTYVDDVWTASIIERDFKGDVLEELRSLEPSEKVNDDSRLQNRISIVADAELLEHFSTIKYVIHRGTRWRVQSVADEYPRLILSLGGVYDGARPS